MHGPLESPPIASLAHALMAQIDAARARATEDPFGNPILSVALSIQRRLDDGTLVEADFARLIAHLQEKAFGQRAGRIAAYVGGVGPHNDAALAAIAARLLRPDPNDSPVPFAAYRDAISRPHFAAVFTAHPTFSLPAATGAALAHAATGEVVDVRGLSHRPTAPTLDEEFDQANAAIAHGRDALDRFAAALLAAAREAWPDRWHTLMPAPVILSSWVGYDTDGRTDIGWYDTLRYRLAMKRLQLVRIGAQVTAVVPESALARRIAAAEAEVAAQLAACPRDPDPVAVQALAKALVEGRDRALTSPAPLLPLFEEAIAGAADDRARLALGVTRAGLVGHGLALAHTHVRLNATQLHNALRQRLGLSEDPEDPAARRTLLASLNGALEAVDPIPVDFGALLAEQASAARLMMTIAQIVKHVDGSQPVRFLVAETETGATLLAALWLARLFGVGDHVEISPLFETEAALENGPRVLDEALRSAAFRAYLHAQKRLCLQFGYSDSGRYVGQLPASYLIERLRLRVAELMARHGLSDVELVLFNTHGESIGRGAHPGSLADRLDYLAPAASRLLLAKSGIRVREESSFQGGDGYLLFGTGALALASIARIAEHAFSPTEEAGDPIYAESDFAADFFATARNNMAALVADRGYAALLGTFGPALLDRTGSRPSARQAEGLGGPAMISHPRELRAIPNNAILQQLGYLANTLHGLGTAAARAPELFADLRRRSPRFARALAFAEGAAAGSDLDVLRAVTGTLDPGTWLDRAAATQRPGRRDALVTIASTLETLLVSASVQAMFRRLRSDQLKLLACWPDLPRMDAELALLHALRLAAIHRIWILAARIPDFSPRHGATRADLLARIVRLDIAAALDLLGRIFPAAPDPSAGLDFHEPAAPRAGMSYGREHEQIFAPMRRMFDLVRETGAAITHRIGALG